MSRMTYGQELRRLCQSLQLHQVVQKCTEMADVNNSVIFHVSHYIINLSNCIYIILREQSVIFDTNDETFTNFIVILTVIDFAHIAKTLPIRMPTKALPILLSVWGIP